MAVQPSANLYVSGLPSGTDEGTLRQILGQYAVVQNCKVLQGGATAMCSFESEDVATKLIELLSGNIPQGLPGPVHMKYANPQGKGQKGEKGAGFYGGAAFGKGAMGGKDGKCYMGMAPPGKGASPYGGDKGGDKGGEPPPNDNLYIIGLPDGIDQNGLLSVFSPYGNIAQCKILGSKNGNTAAMIRFASVAEATLVKDMLNGNIPQGLEKPITVKYSQSGQGKGDGKGGPGDQWGQGSWTSQGNSFPQGGGNSYPQGGGPSTSGLEDTTHMDYILNQIELTGALPGGSSSADRVSLYVGGLPSTCRDYHLYRLFAPFGPIAQDGVKAMLKPDGTCEGFGYVEFLNANAAQNASLVIDGAQLPDGSKMDVKVHSQMPGGGAGGGGKGW